MEEASYPPDEAASRERLQYRLANAGDVFMVACSTTEVVGFVCATLSNSQQMTHDRYGQSGCRLSNFVGSYCFRLARLH